MDDEFNMWDCTWYWDNSFADLSPVGKNNRLGISLCPSRFCLVQSVIIWKLA